MYNELDRLHKACFPEKAWAAADFADLKKSGCEIIASQNAFVVWRDIAGEAELITIGVHPDARRTGTGAALLCIMESELKKTKCTKIFLEVAESNAPARAMYANNGYAEIARRAKYYGDIDAIIMEKKL